jgi:hypothetical protein
MSTRTLAARAGAEMLGSLMTYCLSVGSLSNALLPRTKGEGAPPLCRCRSNAAFCCCCCCCWAYSCCQQGLPVKRPTAIFVHVRKVGVTAPSAELEGQRARRRKACTQLPPPPLPPPGPQAWVCCPLPSGSALASPCPSPCSTGCVGGLDGGLAAAQPARHTLLGEPARSWTGCC